MHIFGAIHHLPECKKCELAAVLACCADGILPVDDFRELQVRVNMPYLSINRTLTCALLCASITACNSEPPPRSVTELMDNPILLEAAVVRCAQNRAESRYDVECLNAREAVRIIEGREEASRRAELEAESERKRQALRRTQEAAAEARRRAEAERRLREEAEYLAQFGESPADVPVTPADMPASGVAESNAPMAVLPKPPQDVPAERVESAQDDLAIAPAPANSNAPVAEIEPDSTPDTTDLEAVREELRRRGDQTES